MNGQIASIKDSAPVHVEEANPLETIHKTQDGPVTDPPKQQQRRIMRRIDFRVTTMTGVIFFISLMDRTNLGFASIAGYVGEPPFLSHKPAPLYSNLDAG